MPAKSAKVRILSKMVIMPVEALFINVKNVRLRAYLSANAVQQNRYSFSDFWRS